GSLLPDRARRLAGPCGPAPVRSVDRAGVPARRGGRRAGSGRADRRLGARSTIGRSGTTRWTGRPTALGARGRRRVCQDAQVSAVVGAMASIAAAALIAVTGYAGSAYLAAGLAVVVIAVAIGWGPLLGLPQPGGSALLVILTGAAAVLI